MILAGDIGGTNTRLAYFQVDGARLKLHIAEKYPSRAHAGLQEIVAKFLSAHRLPVERACFGVAGPVRQGRSETSNLAWVVDAHELAKQLELTSVSLINDLEANAYGIAVLGPQDTVILNRGAPDATGNGAIISAGTGLGEAGLYWDGQRHRPFACEGGHADFAPRNRLERELHEYLQRQLGEAEKAAPEDVHVSYERVLSGPGLVNIYRFLRDSGRGEELSWVETRDQDPAAAISRAALEGRCALCQQALDLFVSFYGAEAGNLALKVLATAGVWVGGGIAPKIVAKLRSSASNSGHPAGAFMQAFTAKGRMQSLLEAIPVRVIVNDQAALLGCAHYARSES